MKVTIAFTILLPLLAVCRARFTKNDETKIREIVDEEILKKEIAKYMNDKKAAFSSPIISDSSLIRGTELSDKDEREEEELLKIASAAVDKEKEPSAKRGTVAPTTEISNKIEECFDMYETKKCRELRDIYDMCDKDDMEKMCAETCGYCKDEKAHAPVDCQLTKYGCCIDGFTPRNDPKGSGCITCVDKQPDLCAGNEADCNSIEWVGNWMRKYCKKTCHVCQVMQPAKELARPACRDDPEQKAFCPSWKSQGLCVDVQELMIAHCPKTCDLCDKVPLNHASGR